MGGGTVSERHAGYVVTLDADLHEDDAEQVLTALRMIRGVVSVVPVQGSIETAVGEERARYELRAKLLEALK